jgi:small basic protein
MAEASRRTQLIGAIAALAAGIVTGFMIHAHPEGLRVPAWVAYMAAAAFVFAGLSLLAGSLVANWLQRWLGIAVALSLFGVSLWVAFGPGERACSVSIPFLQTVAPDALCRGAFGFGSLLIGLFLGLVVHRAMRSNADA